jgi:DNA-binding response OmpR family regulator
MAIYKHQKTAEKIRKMAAKGAASAKDGGNSGGTALGFGFQYSLKDQTLFYFGRQINLTKKEFHFIRLLVENLDRTVTYGKIESYVWGGGGVDQNTLRIFLWRLRSKIGKELIKNTPGLGYRIEKPSSA